MLAAHRHHPWLRRLIISLLVVTAIGVPLALWGASTLIRTATASVIYADLNHLPHHRVALVLGCSPTRANGQANLYFLNRIATAAALFRAHKADYLLVSGDNHTMSYDEPTAMRDALVELGVPAERIIRDHAGFSTFESVIRARDVFGLRDICIVTQRDHGERACYIAQTLGVTADVYPAQDVTGLGGLRTTTREALARVCTLLDLHAWGRTPHFLGPTIPIGTP